MAVNSKTGSQRAVAPAMAGRLQDGRGNKRCAIWRDASV